MEVGTDVRPEWLPISGLELFLSVCFFFLKYLSSPEIFGLPCMNDPISFTRVLNRIF